MVPQTNYMHCTAYAPPSSRRGNADGLQAWWRAGNGPCAHRPQPGMTPSRRAATAAGALAARSSPCAAPPGAAGPRAPPAAARRGRAWAHVGQAGQGGAKAAPPYGVQAAPSGPAPRPALASRAGAAPADSPAAQAAPGACSSSRAGSSAAARHAPGRCAAHTTPPGGGGEAAEACASAAAGQSASRAARARSGAGQQKGGGGERRRRRGGAAGRGRRWRSGVTGRLHAGLPACARRRVWSAVSHLWRRRANNFDSQERTEKPSLRLAIWLPRATRRAWGGRGNVGSACVQVSGGLPRKCRPPGWAASPARWQVGTTRWTMHLVSNGCCKSTGRQRAARHGRVRDQAAPRRGGQARSILPGLRVHGACCHVCRAAPGTGAPA